MSDADNIAMAEQFPQINLLISSVRTLGNRSPRLAGNTLLTQTHYEGKYFGMLRVELSPSGLWEAAAKKASPILPKLLHDDTELNAERQRLSAANPSAKTDANITRLLRRQTALQDFIAGRSVAEPFATYTYRFYALRDNVPELPAISKAVSALKKRINTSAP